jgi:magnesium chelatase family protein
VSFPSRFMLAAAMNPCPCGFFGDPTRDCQCSPPQIQRYVSKISGPLLDRIDIHIEVPAVKYKELRGDKEIESSASVRERVLRARKIQTERYREEKMLYANAQMPPRLMRKFCAISSDGEKLLESAIQRLGLSARAHDRILKVGRTIADLEGAESIEPKHLSEAIQYRTLDRTYWA